MNIQMILLHRLSYKCDGCLVEIHSDLDSWNRLLITPHSRHFYRLALMSSRAYFEPTDNLTDLDLSPRMPWHAHSHEVCVHFRLGELCPRPRKDLGDPTEDPYLGEPVSWLQF